MGLRFLLIYFIFLFIAKHTSIYEVGVLSNNISAVAVVGIIWVYRLLVYVTLPIIIILFVIKFFSKKTHPKK